MEPNGSIEMELKYKPLKRISPEEIRERFSSLVKQVRFVKAAAYKNLYDGKMVILKKPSWFVVIEIDFPIPPEKRDIYQQFKEFARKVFVPVSI